MKTNFQQTAVCLTSDLEESIQIGIASTDEEKAEIYRLRYRIYIEEMQRDPISTDHSSKLLYDEMDTWAHLIYAKVGSEFIGTMRINIGTIDQFPLDMVRVLSLDKVKGFFKDHDNKLIGSSTKLMVSQQYRNSAALHLLTAKGYELYCNHHVRFNFGGCNFYLLRLYELMGCRRFGTNFVDPGYGLLTPIVWIIDDIDHLKAVRSPFFRIARNQKGFNSSSADWFLKEFPEVLKMINSQLITEEELWAVFCNRLGARPEASISALQGLSATEASKFLYRCGVVVQCHIGDQIISRGMASEELNILLSGELLASTQYQGKSVVLPGQHFGTIGLSGPSIQQVDIEAATPAEIVVISRQYFRKFSLSHPDVTNHILKNLGIQ